LRGWLFERDGISKDQLQPDDLVCKMQIRATAVRKLHPWLLRSLAAALRSQGFFWCVCVLTGPYQAESELPADLTVRRACTFTAERCRRIGGGGGGGGGRRESAFVEGAEGVEGHEPEGGLGEGPQLQMASHQPAQDLPVTLRNKSRVNNQLLLHRRAGSGVASLPLERRVPVFEIAGCTHCSLHTALPTLCMHMQATKHPNRVPIRVPGEQETHARGGTSHAGLLGETESSHGVGVEGWLPKVDLGVKRSAEKFAFDPD